MTLDHVGIAAASPEQVALFERLLAVAPYKSEAVEREGVQTTFFGDGGVPGEAPKVELLEATRDDSPIAGFVAKRGPGIHHLAFEVADLGAEMDRARALGIRLLADAPKPGADGKQIVFLHPKDTAGVLVELVQSVRPPPEWTEVDGLAVQVSGPADGPPLLVLHGALGSTELETDRLVRVWERTFRVYALDFGGHGRSRAVEGTPTWETYLANAITASDHFDLRDAAVFGFSMGGAIALQLALARTDLVGRLAVHGVNVQWDADEVETMTRPMEPDWMEQERPFWARRLAETHGADRWRELVTQLAAFTRDLPDQHITDADLARIACPTLVSTGDRDRFFDIRHAVGLYRAIPDAHLQILPEVDHPIQTVDVPRFAAGVADFLRAEG